MNDAAAVRLGQRVGDFEHEFERLVDGQRAPADGLLERAPIDVLHDEEERAVGLVDLVDGADVRVVDGRSGAGLAHEAGARLLVADQVGGQRFDGDDAVQLGVFGFVDDAHAAFAYLSEDAIVKYGFSNH